MSIHYSAPPPPTLHSIRCSLADISSPPPDHRPFDTPRRFATFAHRLSHLLLLPLPHSPPVHTSLKGLATELSKAAETLSVYNNASKILVLLECKSLCSALQERAVAISAWVALLASALPDVAAGDDDDDDLRKKVSENEERVWCTLEKEGDGRESSKAVQSGIVLDLARALGFDPGDRGEFCNQVKLFKGDPLRSHSVPETRVLLSLERILSNWSGEPVTVTPNWDFEIAEDAVAPVFPFKSFLCPLTKEVMRDPVVVLESSQAYEKTAIEYWFERCIQDGREPTCPVTGTVLKSLELKPNIGLAGAIDEWVGRVVEYQIKSAVQYLGEEPLSVDHVERALDHVYKVSEEHPTRRYIIRNAGVVLLIVNVLSNNSKTIGSRLRSKALTTLLSMAKDDQSRASIIDRSMLTFEPFVL